MPKGIYEHKPIFGRKHSEETKKKISESKKKNPVRYWLGKKYSDEHKRKISISRKGYRPSEETKSKTREASIRLGLKPPSFRGKKHSEDTLQKMRDIQSMPRPQNRGENSNHWKGGTTPNILIIRHSFETKVWRREVFERDNWICQKCLERGGYLHCHHNINFSETKDLRFDPNNGTTLCNKCHLEFHKKFGTQNNTYEQLKRFL